MLPNQSNCGRYIHVEDITRSTRPSRFFSYTSKNTRYIILYNYMKLPKIIPIGIVHLWHQDKISHCHLQINENTRCISVSQTVNFSQDQTE